MPSHPHSPAYRLPPPPPSSSTSTIKIVIVSIVVSFIIITSIIIITVKINSVRGENVVYTDEPIEMDNFSIHTSLSEEIEDNFMIDIDTLSANYTTISINSDTPLPLN